MATIIITTPATKCITHIRVKKDGRKERIKKRGYFTYKGIGYAGYAEYVWQWKKFTLNGGIRVQEDEVKCISNNIAGDKRTYRNLFPSIKVGYLFSEKNQASLSYSKRMGNIPYKSMNPAIVYISEYSYAKGIRI